MRFAVDEDGNGNFRLNSMIYLKLLTLLRRSFAKNLHGMCWMVIFCPLELYINHIKTTEKVYIDEDN